MARARSLSPRHRRSGLGPIFALVVVALVVWIAWRNTGEGDIPRISSVRPSDDLNDAKDVLPAQKPKESEQGRSAFTATSQERVQEAKGQETADPVESAKARVEKARANGDPNMMRQAVALLALDDRLPRSLREDYFAKADDLNRRLVFSSSEVPGFLFETIKPGDSYWKIADRVRKTKKLRVTPGFLLAINHVPEARLRANDRLKIPLEPLSLLVDKTDFEIYVLLGGLFLQRYTIGIGRDGLTPEGDFEIGGKMSKPTWTDPKTGKIFKFGEPGHLIGSRWLAFHREGQKTSFGIHGTVEPDSIGQAKSDGCVRLRNEDVEKLFDLVPEGVRVTIRN